MEDVGRIYGRWAFYCHVLYFYDHLIFFGVTLVYCTKKNLATLVKAACKKAHLFMYVKFF
jgi:hypothetical protein